MTDRLFPESALKLLFALAIGLLIGIERGWQERERRPGTRAAGIRTHALIGLLGGTAGLLSKVAGPEFLGFATLGFAGSIALFEYREMRLLGSVSATGLVAALLNFGLAAYAVLGDVITAGAGAVVAAVILAERETIHELLTKLRWIELRSALLLLVMSVVLLPILPDRPIDPWHALNPYQLWLMAIVIAALSYVGYVSVRLWGQDRGLLFAGAAGALVSSTTVTWRFAQIGSRGASVLPQITAGILAAWAISLLRMGSIAVVVAPALFLPLGAVLGSAASVFAIAAVFYYRRRAVPMEDGTKLGLEDPFDIVAVMRFTLLLAIVSLAAGLASHGSAARLSLSALAFASGLIDVDPITLSTAKASGSLGYSYASFVILTAAAANMLAKCVLTAAFGGRRLALPLIGIAVLASICAAGLRLMLDRVLPF